MADKQAPQKKQTQQKTPEKVSVRLRILTKLTLAPEARTEPPKGAYPAGRFKKFFDVFRSNMSSMTLVNLLLVLFLLPLLALILAISVVGVEEFTYIIKGIETIPYLLGNFGIGLSSGASLIATKVDMLLTYRILVSGIAVGLPIFGLGVAGALHIFTKFSWAEGFICKKDKYGNDVPRIVLEFFRGIKLYWKQTVVIMLVYGLLIAGAGNLIITFIEGLWLGTAHAGHYIGLIVAIIVILISSMILINILPLVVSYKLPLVAKLKNAVLLTITFAIPTFFMLVVAVAPFLLALIGGIFMLIIAILIFTLGISYVLLIMVNYSDYNSENILTPLYLATANQSGKKQKKTKK